MTRPPWRLGDRGLGGDRIPSHRRASSDARRVARVSMVFTGRLHAGLQAPCSARVSALLLGALTRPTRRFHVDGRKRRRG